METLAPAAAKNELLEAWRPLANASADFIAVLTPEGRVALANSRMARLLRRPAAQIEGRKLDELHLPRSLIEPWMLHLKEALARRRALKIEHTLGQAGRQVVSRLLPVQMPDDSRWVLCITRHVGSRRLFSQQLQHQALHDPLTGLVNRRGFERELERFIHEARETGRSHALCYLDLDSFKQVNDSCGHGAGDELLRQLPAVLQPRVRQQDTLARLGGDEFGVLLHGCNLDDARRIAETLRDAVQRFRFVWQTRTFSVGVSVGIVGIAPDCEGLDAVLSEADAACYAAKDQGRNSVFVSQPHDLTIIRQRGERRWANRLRQALQSDDGFHLHYQSIFSLQDGQAAPRQHEILLRLPDSSGRPILPGAFLPAAERNGLMGQVDSWVIRRSLQMIGGPLRERLSGQRFGINLSPMSLSDPTLLETIQQGLQEHELAPEILYFELRETAFNLNLGAALEFMRTLNELGCGLSLDGFGSGVSSFSYLKNLPVDMIKIDASLIAEMVGSPADEAIVRAINDIAHRLGIATVAEAIESEGLLAMLRDMGIDYAQGYLLGGPRPLTEFGGVSVPQG